MNNFNPTLSAIVNNVKPHSIVYIGGLFTFTLCFYKIFKRILRIFMKNIDYNIDKQLELHETKFNNLLNNRQFDYTKLNNITNNVDDSDNDEEQNNNNNDGNIIENNEESIEDNDVTEDSNEEDNNKENNNMTDKELTSNNEGEVIEQIEEEKLEEEIVSLMTDLNNGSSKINAIMNELETIVTTEDINDILKEEHTIEEKRDLINNKIHTKITEFINSIENNNDTNDAHIKCERNRNIIQFDDKEKKE